MRIVSTKGEHLKVDERSSYCLSTDFTTTAALCWAQSTEDVAMPQKVRHDEEGPSMRVKQP